MRYAFILATFALTILAAPLPGEQARDVIIDKRYIRKYGQDVTVTSREAEAEPNVRRQGTRMSNGRREAEGENLEARGTRMSNGRREAEAEAEVEGKVEGRDTRMSNGRREAEDEVEARGTCMSNGRREAEAA
ncbi:hypothetical protein K491DRAFT_758630 [Lophiostoma macrostomum CBS 122681]|uniref:Uncharacterized protein n=1 Tax=Lophiostoma macrostomum CBS 122681 TaxID=1314788 RepID=A0A6A6T472_9PLEO|nr:hypothetical protein K491DRAFT_758630 [Lophiostoma macrostomum CBS 122681]